MQALSCRLLRTGCCACLFGAFPARAGNGKGLTGKAGQQRLMVGTVFTINLDDVAHTGLAVREIGRMDPAGVGVPFGRVNAPAARSARKRLSTL